MHFKTDCFALLTLSKDIKQCPLRGHVACLRMSDLQLPSGCTLVLRACVHCRPLFCHPHLCMLSQNCLLYCISSVNICWQLKVKNEVSQLCLTLCDLMDCSLSGSLSMGFSSKSTGVGYHFLLQGIFPTQGSNLSLLHCGQMLYHLSHPGSPGN